MLDTHPSIHEIGVISVPDPHWGERPKTFVTLKSSNTSLDPQEVISWAKQNSNISKFMVPREVEVVPELPKTSTGKLKKNVLREWARGNKDAS